METRNIHRPRSADDVAGLLRSRSPGATGLRVTGTDSRRLLPARPELDVLSCAELQAGVEIDAEEQVLTAPAGAPLAGIEARLEPLALMLPPIPLAAPSGTLGGLFGDPRESPTLQRWGRARDHVLGIEAVLGNGTPIRSGGRVVKNVTGYDLTRLLCGARGRLGVVTRMHWRLLPRPESWCRVTVRCDSPRAWEEALLELRRRGPDPAALIIHSHEVVEIVEAGPAAAVEEHVQRMLRPFLHRGGEEARRELTTAVPCREPPPPAREDRLRVRARAPLRAWKKLLDSVGKEPRVKLRELHPFAHYALLDLPLAPPTQGPFARLQALLRTEGGSLAVEEWPACGFEGLPVSATEPEALRAIRQRLESEWDPHGTLAHGL